MRNLENPKWIYAKAGMFVLIGAISGGLILAANPTAQTAVLLLLAVWSFSRAYYFAFYVIEHYVDPAYKFSGLGSAIRHLISRNP